MFEMDKKTLDLSNACYNLPLSRMIYIGGAPFLKMLLVDPKSSCFIHQVALFKFSFTWIDLGKKIFEKHILFLRIIYLIQKINW